jgi:hypothetical protein
MTRLAHVFVGGLAAAALAFGAAPIAQGPQPSSPRFAPPVASEVLPSAGLITLLDQITLVSGIATGSQNFEPGLDAFDDQVADDFVVPANESWNVDRVHAYGVYFNGAGPATSFHVTFYADNSAHPGVVECEYPSAPFTSSLGDFAITLTGGPCFLPNGTHWVSVQANMNFSPDGQWA